MEAAKAGSVQLVRAILRKGGNPNALDMNRLSAAHYAAMGSFLEVCSTLPKYLFFHCVATKSSEKGCCLRHFQSFRSIAQASFKDHAIFCFLQVMLLLSAFSANMGVMDMEDCTPLHFAAVTGDLNCCKFLAQRGVVLKIV